MTFEEIIQQILVKNPEISREKILERLEDERRKTGGLISDESLLRMIAAEFGVKISKETSVSAALIKDLVPNLNDVSVVGRVVAVLNPKILNEKTGRKMASLLIADKGDILRVVLWNDKASLIENSKVKVGQIARFIHGYTKESRTGKVELHIAEKGEVQINPEDVNAKDYPTISKFNTKIGEITIAHKNKRLNLTGLVEEIFQASTFQRQDASSGKVLRFIMADETGKIPVVVWNEKVDELERILKKGAKLQLVNAKAKKALEESIEIHVDNETYVEIQAPTEFSRIAELKEGMNNVNIEGEVATKPMMREIKTSRGENVKVATFEIKDETGSIWVTAWRQHAQTVAELEKGEKITIKNAYVKRGFADQLEISTRSTTIINVELKGNN
ncbi:MAG: OB-fold nucleic acid binding domain-containing protein [Candidatus Bathyarchaeales archaeon]